MLLWNYYSFFLMAVSRSRHRIGTLHMQEIKLAIWSEGISGSTWYQTKQSNWGLIWIFCCLPELRSFELKASKEWSLPAGCGISYVYLVSICSYSQRFVGGFDFCINFCYMGILLLFFITPKLVLLEISPSNAVFVFYAGCLTSEKYKGLL